MMKAAGFAAAVLLLAGCDRPPEMVIYTSADEQVARPVFERFEKETGIRVLPKFDSEATKTTGLASLLRSEKERPRADVFWSNEQAAMVALASEGLLEPGKDNPVVAHWPERWRAADGSWVALAGRARVIVYDPAKVKNPPALWTELTYPEWKGRIAMADPRFGTTRGHLGGMKAYWDANAVAGYYEAWAEGLLENDPKLLTSGNAGVVDAISRGEADIGLTDTDDVLAAQARGIKVAMVFPRHARTDKAKGGGTLLIPNTVGIVKGAPHAELARRFVDFMLDPKTERQLADMTSKHAPVVLEAKEGDLSVPDPLNVDAARAAAVADAAVEHFMLRKKQLEEERRESTAGRNVPEPEPEPESSEEGAP